MPRQSTAMPADEAYNAVQHPRRRLHLLRCVAYLVLLFGSAGLGLAAWWFFPDVDAELWRSGAPQQMWAHRLQNEAATRSAQRRTRFTYVPLAAISPPLRLAVLVAEDVGFFEHGPIDVFAQYEAVQQWWEMRHDGRRLRGASTITQQLAKNLFLSADRTVLRKVQELRMAYWLERHLGKARIFELYCNVIELGPQVYGVDAAARHYFGVSAAELDASRAALLAATIPAPMVSNPRSQTRAFLQRRRAVVERMQHLRHLQQALQLAAQR